MAGISSYKPPTAPPTPTYVPPPKPVGVQMAPAPAAAPPPPSFQPPAPVKDPRIDALIAQLSKQSQPTTYAPSGNTAALQQQIQDSIKSSSSNSGQSAQLQALMSQLMSGNGPKIGDVSNDPAAVAYDVAARRSAEEARGSEAARQGASGLAGSGDFDARLAQINEATGQDVAGFKAGLANQRQTEATQNAVTGAGLQLSDLERQRSDASTKTGNLQNLLAAMTQQDQFGQSQQQQQGQFDKQSNEALLAQLLGEQGRTQSQASSSALTAEQLRRQELDRQLATGQSYQPPVPYNPYGGARGGGASGRSY